MDALPAELMATMQAMLRPARPHLSLCRARANARVTEERRNEDRRAEALADCVARIEQARASVFAAGDGVVKADMTALEREWRTLARAQRSCEERTLALWNAIAPRHWAGALRWTSTGDSAADIEACVALASDPDGVERAESCALRLASLLATSGVDVAPAVTWQVAHAPAIAPAAVLFERPLRDLTEAVASTYGGDALLARADARQQDVLDTASQSALFTGFEGLAADLALVARIDFLWRASRVDSHRAEADRPTAALLDLWSTGYVVSAIDPQRITLGALTAT